METEMLERLERDKVFLLHLQKRGDLGVEFAKLQIKTRDLIIKSFGLDGSSPETLESIARVLDLSMIEVVETRNKFLRYLRRRYPEPKP